MKLPKSLVVSVLALAYSVFAESGGLENPGLQPLIIRANGFLAAGQFNDAVKALTDALGEPADLSSCTSSKSKSATELSPLDYLLYYKRATAQLSLSRHAQALEDFEHVIRHSKGSFEKAYLMQGNIYLKEGRWKEAKEMMSLYKGKDKGAQDVVRLPPTL
jgi:DnaJ family protein C protein 3